MATLPPRWVRTRRSSSSSWAKARASGWARRRSSIDVRVPPSVSSTRPSSNPARAKCPSMLHVITKVSACSVRRRSPFMSGPGSYSRYSLWWNRSAHRRRTFASGEASPCSMQPMPSAWARSPYASRKWVSAEKRLSPSAMSSPLLAPMMTRSASESALPMRTAFAVSMCYLPSVLRTSASTSAMSARTASPRSSIARGRNCVLSFTAI